MNAKVLGKLSINLKKKKLFQKLQFIKIENSISYRN